MFDLIQWRARKSPEAPALFFNGRWYSYREMDGRANRLANRLLSLGIQRGDRVGVIAQNHLVHFDLLLAAPKVGIVFAPFNPHLGRDALAAMVAQVKPALVFADSRSHAAAAALGVPWTRLSDYREWLAVGSLDLPPMPALDTNDPYMLLGTPGGMAVLPYRQVLLNARHAADAWGLSSRDGTVHCLPCFGPELNLLCLPLLYRGGRVVLMSAFDTDEYLGHLALHRVTVSALRPGMLRQLCEYGDFDEADLSSLHWFGSVGAPAPAPVRQMLARRGLPVRTLVGIAEVGPNLFHATLEDSGRRPELLGQPLPEVELTLRRADGTVAAEGETGTLSLSGPMLFSGYLDAKQAAVPKFDHGQFASEIVARKDLDGEWLWFGSGQDAFTSGTTLIYPGEIEAALFKLDSVLDCAVSGVADRKLGMAILVSVVVQDGAPLHEEALRASLAAQLPAAFQPSHFQRVKMLPRDAWGAVKRDELSQQFARTREG